MTQTVENLTDGVGGHLSARLGEEHPVEQALQIACPYLQWARRSQRIKGAEERFLKIQPASEQIGGRPLDAFAGQEVIEGGGAFVRHRVAEQLAGKLS